MSEYVGVPDGFTPVVGWRSWKLTMYDSSPGHLFLQGMQGYWATDGPTRAFCGAAPRSSTAHAPDGRNFISVPNPNYDAERRQWMSAHGSCTPSEYDPINGTHFVKAGPVTIAVTRPVDPGTPHVPSALCGCGLYVASSLTEARKYLYPMASDLSYDIGIIGRAALWGTVVEHETGARGEYGYPQAFYVPDAIFDKAAPKLKAAFKVPVFRMSELPDARQEITAEHVAQVMNVPLAILEGQPSRRARLWGWLNKPSMSPLIYLAALLAGNAATTLLRVIHP